MNMHPHEKIGGVRTLVRTLARDGSMMGTWDEAREQTSLLERSGSVDVPGFTWAGATFEAKRYKDDRQRLRTLYLARLAGSRELVVEELSDDLKARLAKAMVSASVSERIIKTDAMSTEPDDDGDPMNFLDDEEQYVHTQSVEYRLNGNAEILECVRSDEYTQGGETLLDVRYSEPYQRGRIRAGLMPIGAVNDTSLDITHQDREVLARDLAVDVALFEQLDAYCSDSEAAAISRLEHERRIFAIAAFIRLREDPVELLQIALS